MSSVTITVSSVTIDQLVVVGDQPVVPGGVADIDIVIVVEIGVGPCRHRTMSSSTVSIGEKSLSATGPVGLRVLHGG